MSGQTFRGVHDRASQISLQWRAGQLSGQTHTQLSFQ